MLFAPMVSAVLFLAGHAQLLPQRCIFPGQPDDNLGAFSIQLGEDWKPKLATPSETKNLFNLRETVLLGPHKASMSILRILKPEPDLLKALPKELDNARQNDPDHFRSLNLNGYVGGFYPMATRHNRSPVWIVGKTTDGKEIFSISISAEGRFSDYQLNVIEAMLRTLRSEAAR